MCFKSSTPYLYCQLPNMALLDVSLDNSAMLDEWEALEAEADVLMRDAVRPKMR